MPRRENIYAWTEVNLQPGIYPAYVSLNRESNGQLTLSVRSRDEDVVTATVVLPPEEHVKLAEALIML